jgi:hypothetical protein
VLTSIPCDASGRIGMSAAPSGSRSVMKLWNCAKTSFGSWSATRRKDTLALASDAITVLLPARCSRPRCR